MSYNPELALMCGSDIPIPECQVVIHQPTIKEIALIGETEFFSGVRTLCINKNIISQDETLLEDTNNFQIFMMVMQEKETSDKKEAVKQLFPLLFPEYQLLLTPRSLVLQSQNNNVIIDENNFDALQKILNQIFCISSGPMDTQSFNPGDKKAKEIAEKLMKARQRVAAQKEEGNGSVFAQYLSVLTVGINSMSLEDCKNLTMYQLFDLVERKTLYTNWDLDIKSRLAGGKPDKPVDNWMKNIH